MAGNAFQPLRDPSLRRAFAQGDKGHGLGSWLPWLLALLASLAVAWAPLPLPASQPVDRHFRIEASSFEYSPGVMRVNPGDRVTIDLVSTDVVHGLYLDGYDIKVSADPGQTARLQFTADESGSFRFRCSVTCGPLHPFMIGKLSVGPNLLLWKSLAIGMLLAFAAFWSLR